MPEPLPAAAQTLLGFLESPTLQIVARLGTNPIPDPDLPIGLADFVEATFPGYAALPIPAWDLVDNAEEDYAEALTPTLEWSMGPNPAPQTITCVCLTQKKGTDPNQLLWIFPLPSSIVLDTEGQTYRKKVRICSADLTEA